MAHPRSRLVNPNRTLLRRCSLLPLLVTMALFCGCHSRSRENYRGLRFVMSSDGKQVAFTYHLRSERPDQWGSNRYLLADLSGGTAVRPGPFSRDKPIWDRVLGWSEQQQAFVIERKRPLGPYGAHPHCHVALEILTSSLKGGEKRVCVWPSVGFDENHEDYEVRLLGLTARQDRVFFAEDVGSASPKQQRLGSVDLV